jgi:cell division protein FtsB
MKRVLPLFYSVYIGICVYTVLILVFGASGIIAYQRLENFKKEIDKNLVILEKTHKDLGKELNLLTSSSEVIRLKSRELGYFEEDEIVVKVVGLKDKRDFHSVGRMIQYSDGNTDKKPLFRIISFTSALAFFLIISALKRKSSG